MWNQQLSLLTFNPQFTEKDFFHSKLLESYFFLFFFSFETSEQKLLHLKIKRVKKKGSADKR